MVAFDITDILADIEDYEGKYLTLYFAGYTYGNRGALLTTLNADGKHVNGFTQADYNDVMALSFDGYAGSGSTNGWVAAKIAISDLKTYAATHGGTYIAYHFKANQNTPFYFYSIEITD